MILRFSFYQVYDNGVLENILSNILKMLKIDTVIEVKEKEVFLYANADEQSLKNFSNELSNLLPISLFYKFLKTDIVDKMPSQKPLKKCFLNLPFSHLELKEFLKNPKFDNFTLDEVDEKISDLKNGKVIKITTREGEKSVGLIRQDKKELLKNRYFVVMPTDLSLLNKMVILSQNEKNALISFEKPTLELKMNLVYKSKDILSHDFVNVKMCDSLLLFYICKKLFEDGEEFLFLSDEEMNHCGELVYKQSFIKDVKVNILENGSAVLLDKHDYMQNKNLPYFNKKAHERFSSVIYEYNLFKSKNLNFFLSFKYDDFACVYDEKSGLVELVCIKKPNSFKELIENIKKDENGKKLLENYEKNFPDLLKNALSVEILKTLPNNFYTLLGVVGVLLGYGKKVESASKNMLEFAKRFSHTKGVRIDVKLKEQKLPNCVNVEKFIQSALSFRLAGAEPETLSFGCFESIAYFISDLSDLVAKEYGSENVSLCGEFFSFKRVLEVAAKNIQPNHQIYINRAYSLE